MNRLLKTFDHAQEFLVPYLAETEKILRCALRKIDPAADCAIVPVADLGVPHDVIRIVGGFATGCFVKWECDTPVIPVDTTVNVDTSSLFYLDGDIGESFTQKKFDFLKEMIEGSSSYEWNFHKGNHFISHSVDSSGGDILVLHSNEKEFKYQYNGLMPVPGNWFMKDVRNLGSKDRPMNLLIGDKAIHFYNTAKMLENYNIIRHAFFAGLISEGVAIIKNEYHKQHYFMPDSNSVAMGCYVCEEREVVPIFSSPGRPISLFSPLVGGKNQVELSCGARRLLVPHGWGKTSIEPLQFHHDGKLSVNGMQFDVVPKSTLGIHPKLQLREFDDDIESPHSFASEIKDHCPGEVADSLQQIRYYNKSGVTLNCSCG